MENIKDQVITIASKYSKRKPDIIDNGTLLEKDLGFDSIRVLSFIVELEEKFNIEFNDEILSDIFSKTLIEIVEYINEQNKINVSL